MYLILPISSEKKKIKPSSVFFIEFFFVYGPIFRFSNLAIASGFNFSIIFWPRSISLSFSYWSKSISLFKRLFWFLSLEESPKILISSVVTKIELNISEIVSPNRPICFLIYWCIKRKERFFLLIKHLFFKTFIYCCFGHSMSWSCFWKKTYQKRPSKIIYSTSTNAVPLL